MRSLEANAAEKLTNLISLLGFVTYSVQQMHHSSEVASEFSRDSRGPGFEYRRVIGKIPKMPSLVGTCFTFGDWKITMLI